VSHVPHAWEAADRFLPLPRLLTALAEALSLLERAITGVRGHPATSHHCLLRAPWCAFLRDAGTPGGYRHAAGGLERPAVALRTTLYGQVLPAIP
jgi:hypothetical protein